MNVLLAVCSKKFDNLFKKLHKYGKQISTSQYFEQKKKFKKNALKVATSNQIFECFFIFGVADFIFYSF
jgi:hypothetical protein